MSYTSFVFKGYHFDATSKVLSLDYSLDNTVNFTEKYNFDFDFATNLDGDALDVALQTLFFLAGVSYYKTYLPPNIIVEAGSIDPQTAKFLDKTYRKGLGEFFFVNDLDPDTSVTFPVNAPDPKQVTLPGKDGILIGIGGGKDSLVSVERLRNQPNIATWSLGHRSQLGPLIKCIGLEHLWVERTIDPLLLKLNSEDALNGHVPISAILSAVGVVVAILSGHRDVVVSNESSADEPTLVYKNTSINHQYSKSSEYEADFQSLLLSHFGDSIRYYSFLRPLSEVKIAQIFANVGFDKYKDVFSSCNRAFIQSSTQMSWCGECSKCAFTFLALTPFVDKDSLEKLFGGKNLLQDPNLVATYSKLLGIDGEKPLDCVGEIKESREAMDLAKKIYPELADKYIYDLPADYSYESLAPHHMPENIYSVLKPVL